MKCYTIQNKDVLNTLNNEGIYYTDRMPKQNNLKKAYEFAKQTYGFIHTPIFMIPDDKPGTFYGCTMKDSVGLILDIPDKYIKIQDYYNWVDVIYFLELTNEFYEVYDLSIYSNPEEMAKDVLLNSKLSDTRYNQIMVEFIDKSWIKYVVDPIELIDLANADKIFI